MGVTGGTAESFEQRVRAREETWLSPLAVRSFETRGRGVPEEPCGVRTPFQRDRDRLAAEREDPGLHRPRG
jgi:dGTPase